ncbi:MAG: RICIN domain-containing protein, partial [Verrucomicrobiota bacterium]
ESTEWYLKPVGDGAHFYIVSVESGLFLETTNTPDESWVKTKAVRLVGANSDFSVQWRKEDIGSGEFMLKNREYGRFLQCSPSVDLDTGSSEGGRQIRAHNSQLNMARWREIALEE